MKKKPLTDSQIKEGNKVVGKSIEDLYLIHPLYAAILMQQQRLITNRVDTCAVDGRNLFVNPEFFGELTEPERIFILAHEAAHLWKMDPLRFTALIGEEPETADYISAQVAGDLIINNILEASGIGLLPESGLIDPIPFTGRKVSRQKIKDYSLEKLYKIVRSFCKIVDVDGGGGETGRCMPYDLGDNGGPEVTPEQAKQNIENDLLAAAESVKDLLPGSESADMAKEFLDNFATYSVDWKQELRKYITESLGLSRQDFSFRRPRRRYIHEDIYLPCRVGKGKLVLVIAVDTSGSMDAERMTAAYSEIKKILAAAKEKTSDLTLHVIECDAAVHGHHVYKLSDIPENLPDPRGGGGTAFLPVFRSIEKKKIRPNLMVYLSDMEVCDINNAKKPSYPVIFLNCSGDERGSNLVDWVANSIINVETR